MIIKFGNFIKAKNNVLENRNNKTNDNKCLLHACLQMFVLYDDITKIYDYECVLYDNLKFEKVFLFMTLEPT